MKTTCLISNFNYAQFVCESIEAALRQTVPFDQIVVVDDGSSDGSVELLRNQYGRHSVVQVVSQSNQGQLSCFNEGFARATGEVVFFLDADDMFEPDYVEKALKVYREHASCDFLFCGRRLFGEQDGTVMRFPEDRDLGYSVVQTAYARSWIVAATSCLSMRRALLQKILPLPYIDEWRVRADDCLVFGSSLAGGRKRFLAQPLVRYRVHATNYYHGRKSEHGEIYRRQLAINRLFEHFERGLCFNSDRLAEVCHREFLTLEKPTIRQLMMYSRISMGARLSITRRLRCVAEMLGHFFGATHQRGGVVPNESSLAQDRSKTIPLRIPERHGAGDARVAIQASRPDGRVA